MALFVGKAFAVGLICLFADRMLISEQTTSWNQRLTVVVDTPAGKVQGAAVTEISKISTSGVLVPVEARGVRTSVRGEAVAVEVLPGRWLFALLSGDADDKGEAGQLVYSTFPLRKDLGSESPSHASNMAALRALPMDVPAPIPPEAFPFLVTFDDINNPETVREVDPDDLAATFGSGVSLSGLTLEITEDAITEGRLRSILKWLGPDPEPHLVPGDGRTTTAPLAMRINVGDFIRELP